jgi:hypothetical protein
MSTMDEMRARVRGRVWQVIAQSGIMAAGPGIPREMWDSLVGGITDGVLLELDAVIDTTKPKAQVVPPMAKPLGPVVPTEPPPPAPPTGQPVPRASFTAPGAEREKTLWKGRPFFTFNERYIVTTERVCVIYGLISRQRDDIELLRLRDLDYRQNVGERLISLGDITLYSTDASMPHIILRNVHRPDKVHEIIRRAMLSARQRSPYYRQEQG